MKKLKRPNILYIYTDQQRLDTLSCYGGKFVDTPNIDSIAADGVRFTNYFVNNPVCSPSRISFLTGRYCSSLGVGNNGIPLPCDAVPMQQLLSPYSYTTAQIGKLHFDPHARRNHKNPTSTYGFDTFILSDEPGCYDDAYTKWVEAVAPEQLEKVRTSLPPAAKMYGKTEFTDQPRETHEPFLFEADADLSHSAFVSSEVCSYLDNYDSKNPFFLIAGFYAPHTPVNPPKECLERVHYENLKPPVLGENEKFSNIIEHLSDEEWIEIKAYYYALVAHVDDCVGEILDKLKEKGLYDDTIIVFTSDHGEFLGDHGRIQKGMPGQDCVTNVPCIIKYTNKIAPNSSVDSIVEGVDILPTMLDYAGIQSPSFVQGKSLKPFLENKTTSHKDAAIIEWIDPAFKQTTIMTQNYMYSFDSNQNELLYDRINDPAEHINLANNPSHSEILSEMRKKALQKVQEASYLSQEKVDVY